jgi:hypothetical protein
MKIRVVGAELLHVEGQTDRHVDANSRFSQLCELHQNLYTKNSHDQTGKNKSSNNKS